MYAYRVTADHPGLLRQASPGAVLVVNGTRIIDGTGSPPSEPSDVTIVDGLIASIQLARETKYASGGAEVIDAWGTFITPGLIDCHVHLTGTRGADVFRRYIEEQPSIRIIRAIRDANRILRRGFTSVRHLGHGDADQAQAVKQAIAMGLVAGPRMLTCGWAISQTGGHGVLAGWPLDLVEQLRPRGAFADGPDLCRKLVRRNLGDGADCIKISTTEGSPAFPDNRTDITNFTDAEIAAVTDEAHRRGATVAAHATALVGSIAAITNGADTLEHGPSKPDDELIAMMLRSGSVLTPTLSAFERGSRLDEERPAAPGWVPERARSWLEGRRDMVRAASEAGIPIATGTDSGGPPGGGENAEEMRALVRAGLSPLQAMRAGTLDSARGIGLADRIGSVEVGKLADLVLWKSDPTTAALLADPEDIRMVIQSYVQIVSPYKAGDVA